MKCDNGTRFSLEDGTPVFHYMGVSGSVDSVNVIRRV